MKQMLTFCALVLGLVTVTSAAQARCPAGLECKTATQLINCEELRAAIMKYDGVFYGSSLYFNRDLAATNSAQTDFCEDNYGTMSTRKPALPVRTRDERGPFGCPLSDVAFKCGRERSGH